MPINQIDMATIISISLEDAPDEPNGDGNSSGKTDQVVLLTSHIKVR